MPPETAQELRSILRSYWGYEDFRSIQPDIMGSIMAGADTLGLMPTGGGKSLTFQVPALAKEGVCLVVTPLIALMKDQVAALRKRGIIAAALHMGQSRSEIERHLDNCILGRTKLLYLSPERIGSRMFQQKVTRMRVSFITVDEAHCISQWGHDFRPSYLEIPQLRRLVPDAPVLALTATATPRVVEDIVAHLQRPGDEEAPRPFRLFKMSFERKNLAYVVRRTDDKYGELLHILRSVPGSAIVYTRSRSGTRDIARALCADGEPALYYHAGLNPTDKDLRQQRWQAGEVRVMVATNAFGMGIDKSDVRLVIHIDIPDSLEAYFQEAGRAGRDGKKSYAVLLVQSADQRTLHHRISENFPDKEYVRRVYDSLCYFYEIPEGGGSGVRREFNIEAFSRAFRLFPTQVLGAFGVLARAGYVSFEEDAENTARVAFTVRRDELYRLNHLSEEQESVVQALLRNYAGLFSDFVGIDVKFLALKTGLSEHVVYDCLVSLSREGILSFVPHSRTPVITFLQRRVEGSELAIPAMAYEDRLADYTARVEAVIDYAMNADTCRSAYMRRYFGEEAGDCGVCDVCLAKKHQPSHRPKDLKEHLLSILADGRGHDTDDFIINGVPRTEVAAALKALLAKERIVFHSGKYFAAAAKT